MMNTTELLEASEQETMAKLSSIVKDYYQKYKQAGEDKNLTINHIEQFLIDSKSKVDTVLRDASAEIVEKMEADMIEKKTYAPTAERN